MNFFKNIMLLIIAMIICVAFLEFASRILKLHSDTDPTYILNDPVLPFSMRPNSQSRSIYGKNFRINNHGLRGPDFNLLKEINKKRILFLGDSVTYGYCVNYNETFSGILATKFASSEKFKAEVINAGHNGFNIKDSANYYKTYGNKFAPDLIIIAVTASDNTSQSIEYFIQDGINYSKNSQWINIPPFIKSILRKSSLYMTIGLVKARIEFMKIDQNIENTINAVNPMISSVKVDIENLKKYSTNLDTPLWIMSVPSQTDVIKGEYQERFFKDLELHSEKLNVPYIDTLVDFKKNDQNYCLNDGAHLSQVGHSVIANNLYKKILNYYTIN